MLPELEEAFAAIDAAQAEIEKVRSETPECDYDLRAEECPRCTALAKPKEALRAGVEPAWRELQGSQDPLVLWIAEHCERYVDEALMVVRLLPAPMTELDALALREGWCETWDALKRKAGRAGVLPAQSAEVSA